MRSNALVHFMQMSTPELVQYHIEYSFAIFYLS